MCCRVLAVLGSLAAGCAAAQPAAQDTKFRVDVRAKLSATIAGQEQKLEADAAYEYTWKRDGKTRTLVVDSAEVRAAADGREMMNARMNREGFSDKKAGAAKEDKTAEAPAELKQLLTDSFGSPICKIELDDTGKELKRTMLAGPGATVLVDSGMVANTRMFHPWYSADKDQWQADMEVSTGNGLATGKATYTKVPGGKGVQAVKVSGTLTADGVKGMGGLTIKAGKYKVEGEQTYDLERKEWVAGKLTMDVTFKMHDGADEIGSVKGTMIVTFALVPQKK
jgi:hypothetical protein